MIEFLLNRFRGRGPEVLDHWYVLLPDFGCSTQEFYESIEKELEMREVPGLEVSRIEHTEGSILSSRREYLQLKRERLLFEICSAPFGTSWFFSCRFSQFRMSLRLWHLMALALLGIVICNGFYFVFEFWWAMAFSVLFVACLIYITKVASLEKGFDVDTKLLALPVIGPVYETLFRRNTYYRQDTRIMYTELIDAVVRAKIREIAGEHRVGKGETGEPGVKRDDSLIDLSLKGIFRRVLKICSDLQKG